MTRGSSPNRTWASPKASDVWQSLQKAVRAASERALATLGQPPSEAVVSLRVDVASSADIKELHRSPKSQVRGVVWLAGMPFEERPTIQVTHSSGTRSFTSKDQLALGGSVFVFEDDRDKVDLDAVLEQLSGTMYGKLVRELLKRRESLEADFVTAHVAHALALQAIKPTETRGVEFTCFKPTPLDARGLTSLLRRHSSVRVLTPVEACDVDLALVEDDGFTSRVLLEHLGKRVRRKRPETEPLTPAPPQPVILTASPAHKPKPTARPPAPPPEPRTAASAPGGHRTPQQARWRARPRRLRVVHRRHRRTDVPLQRRDQGRRRSPQAPRAGGRTPRKQPVAR